MCITTTKGTSHENWSSDCIHRSCFYWWNDFPDDSLFVHQSTSACPLRICHDEHKETNVEQLIVTARNIRVFIDENEEKPVTPEIEVVLTTMDRSVQFLGAALANIEQTKTIRFVVNPEGARKLAESLQEWASDAEEKAGQINEALSELKSQEKK